MIQRMSFHLDLCRGLVNLQLEENKTHMLYQEDEPSP